MSSDEESDEELSFKPLRKTLISMYEELTRTLETIHSIQTQISQPNMYSYLEKILPKFLETNAKGIELYDFIRSDIEQKNLFVPAD
jgi:hypothetical protein